MTERMPIRVGPLQRHIYPYSVAVDDLLTRTKQIIVDQDTGNFYANNSFNASVIQYCLRGESFTIIAFIKFLLEIFRRASERTSQPLLDWKLWARSKVSFDLAISNFFFGIANKRITTEIEVGR